MDKEKIKSIIIGCVKDYLETKDNTEEIVNKLTKDTPLIGNNSVLDSIGLVNIVVDIETEFLDNNIEISLLSDKAMSSRISPFRSIGALSNFIYNQINGKDE